jgi:PKD repeat protein
MTLSDSAGILLGVMVIFLMFAPVSAQDQEYVIDFTANITLGEAPLTVEFTDISTVPGEVRFRSWNFGDGTTNPSMDAQVYHEYIDPGIYSVRMDRSDEFGSHSLIKYDYIQVTSGPIPTPTPTTTVTTATPTSTVSPTTTVTTATPTPTLGPEVPPSEFYGTVMISGIPAQAGTVVAGYIHGEQRGSIVVSSAGNYGGSGPFDTRLVIHAYEQDFTGGNPVILFTVGGQQADQTAVFQSGSVRELGLTAGSPTPTTTTVTPTPTVTTVTPTPTTTTLTPTPTVTTVTPTPTGTQTGTLQVFSTPTNASVTVDSVFVGMTPLFLPGVPAGSHTIAIDKTGYHHYEVQAFIQAGSTTTVIATLVPVTPTPTASPTLTPPPTFPTPTPTATTITPTPTTVTPTPTVTTVTPTPTTVTPTPTTTTLTPTPTVTTVTPTPTGMPTGTLQVFSTPTNASVTVDGVFAGMTPLFLPGLSAGTHAVAVDKAGYHHYEVQAFIQAGSTTTVIATLVPVTPTPTASPTLTPPPTFPTPTPTVTPTPTTVTPTPTPTLGPEVPPSEFYGPVSLDGAPVPAGTVVAGYIHGEQRGIIVVSTAGTYGGSGPFDARLVVHAYEQDFTGGDPVIQFTVGGRLADQTAVFQSGSVRELGLSAESPTPTPTVTTITPTLTVTTVTPTPTLTTSTFTPTPTPTATPTTFPTTQPTPPPSSTNLTLYTGWNFVSIPVNLEPGYNTAGVVFFGVDTAAHSLFSYNASTGQWDTLARDDPLTAMETIWVYSREPMRVDLVLSSNQSYTGRNLFAGWNGFGIPGTTIKTAAQGMAPVDPYWSLMIGFDARFQGYESSIIRGGSGEHSDSRIVEPGKGYWVFMNRNQTYIPAM